MDNVVKAALRGHQWEQAQFFLVKVGFISTSLCLKKEKKYSATWQAHSLCEMCATNTDEVASIVCSTGSTAATATEGQVITLMFKQCCEGWALTEGVEIQLKLREWHQWHHF